LLASEPSFPRKRESMPSVLTDEFDGSNFGNSEWIPAFAGMKRGPKKNGAPHGTPFLRVYRRRISLR
jgi:hypothetical protein